MLNCDFVQYGGKSSNGVMVSYGMTKNESTFCVCVFLVSIAEYSMRRDSTLHA
jgi:hypothetical protein